MRKCREHRGDDLGLIHWAVHQQASITCSESQQTRQRQCDSPRCVNRRRDALVSASLIYSYTEHRSAPDDLDTRQRPIIPTTLQWDEDHLERWAPPDKNETRARQALVSALVLPFPSVLHLSHPASVKSCTSNIRCADRNQDGIIARPSSVPAPK